MAKDSVKVEFIKGQAVTPRRGIAWLEVEGDGVIDAKAVFEGLKESRKQYLMTSFGQWIDFKDIPDRYHGWPGEPEFKACWQFNFRDKTGRNRLYGFKIHPGIPSETFEICVLAMHANKNQKLTDPFIKRSLVKLMTDEEIQAAIKKQIEKYLSEQ